eukprot:1836095-Pleurochrysis_carterae.AAC.1
MWNCARRRPTQQKSRQRRMQARSLRPQAYTASVPLLLCVVMNESCNSSSPSARSDIDILPPKREICLPGRKAGRTKKRRLKPARGQVMGAEELSRRERSLATNPWLVKSFPVPPRSQKLTVRAQGVVRGRAHGSVAACARASATTRTNVGTSKTAGFGPSTGSKSSDAHPSCARGSTATHHRKRITLHAMRQSRARVRSVRACVCAA